MKQAIQALSSFLAKHDDGTSPLLAAISGGGDSLTLLHALASLDVKKRVSVVHVDHQWRKGSGQEAAGVEARTNELGLPYYGFRVPRELSENGARQQRLTIYRDLIGETGAQAVLLAHHRGDLAETTFKRLMEGAPLPKLAAIQSVNIVEEVPVWRPFLKLDKADLSIPPLADDTTNADPRYYRARLRTQIVPFLEETLDKSVLPSLSYLAEQADHLADYLDHQARPLLSCLKQGPLGLYLDFSDRPHPFLCAHLVRRLCPGLSRQEVDLAATLLHVGAANRSLSKGVKIDRYRLFLFTPPPSLPPHTLPLSLGTQRYGPWFVEVTHGARGASGWQAVWEGKATVSLPAGNYRIAPSPRGRKLSKVLTANGVPAFLRPYFPVVMEGDRLAAEWWVGRSSETSEIAITLSPAS